MLRITLLALLMAALFVLTAPAALADGQTAMADSLVLPVPQVAPEAPVELVAKGPPKQIQRPGLKAPEHAPNVVIVLLDDVGFGAASTFGGPVPTPTLSSLAEQGLSYNNFNTAGICSPTRAALLTGRNSHAVGVGNVLNSVVGREGRNGILTDRAATIAEILRQHGYSTAAFGKWHLTPAWEMSPAGPFDRWPTNKGFDTFYGFLQAEMDQFHPILYKDTAIVKRPRRKDNYNLTRDLATHAIQWMHLQHSVAPDKPFFVYFAAPATHAPLQAPDKWIEKFVGDFTYGWNVQRHKTFQRQKAMGVITEDAELTPPPDIMPDWDSLSADEQKVAARYMAVYAAYLAQTDAQVGRVVDALKAMNEFDNTLFIYIVGDNGAAAAGGVLGAFNSQGSLQGVPIDTQTALANLAKIGGPESHPQYSVGWAWAMDTPFKWTKTVASYLGAVRNPMVITWPDRIEDGGGMRTQFSYVTDIVPTILDAAGIKMPARVNGVPQIPLDGTSLIYTFDHPNAASRHHTQYFDVFGNRAIYHDGWMASAFHRQIPWHIATAKPKKFRGDEWELYHLAEDFSQANNLAEERPAKLRQMKHLFWAVAARNNVLPLTNNRIPQYPDRLAGEDGKYVYHAGTVGLPTAVAPPIYNRSYTITAKVNVPESGGHGVIVAQGGHAGGWSLYLNKAGHPVYTYNLFDVARITIVGDEPLPVGESTLRMAFDYAGGGFGQGGTFRLSVNGAAVGQASLERTAPAMFTLYGTFDVGTDLGSAAGAYEPYYRFNGKVKRVTVNVQ